MMLTVSTVSQHASDCQVSVMLLSAKNDAQCLQHMHMPCIPLPPPQVQDTASDSTRPLSKAIGWHNPNAKDAQAYIDTHGKNVA